MHRATLFQRWISRENWEFETHRLHHAARKLAEDLAAVSLLLTQKASREGQDRSGDFYVVDIWRKHGDGWQMIARYSSPMGKRFDRMRPQ